MHFNPNFIASIRFFLIMLFSLNYHNVIRNFNIYLIKLYYKNIKIIFLGICYILLWSNIPIYLKKIYNNFIRIINIRLCELKTKIAKLVFYSNIIILISKKYKFVRITPINRLKELMYLEQKRIERNMKIRINQKI